MAYCEGWLQNSQELPDSRWWSGGTIYGQSGGTVSFDRSRVANGHLNHIKNIYEVQPRYRGVSRKCSFDDRKLGRGHHPVPKGFPLSMKIWLSTSLTQQQHQSAHNDVSANDILVGGPPHPFICCWAMPAFAPGSTGLGLGKGQRSPGTPTPTHLNGAHHGSLEIRHAN